MSWRRGFPLLVRTSGRRVSRGTWGRQSGLVGPRPQRRSARCTYAGTVTLASPPHGVLSPPKSSTIDSAQSEATSPSPNGSSRRQVLQHHQAHPVAPSTHLSLLSLPSSTSPHFKQAQNHLSVQLLYYADATQSPLCEGFTSSIAVVRSTICSFWNTCEAPRPLRHTIFGDMLSSLPVAFSHSVAASACSH